MTNGTQSVLKFLIVIATFLFGCIWGVMCADAAQIAWLYKWQTLITGGLALIAASVGACHLNRQIRQDRDLETERRQLRHRAVRAVLPLTLSSVTEYAENSAALLRSILKKCENGVLTRSRLAEPLVLPLVPAAAIQTLKEFVENSSDIQSGEAAKLISAIQLLTARIRGIDKSLKTEWERVTDDNIIFYIINAAEVITLMSQLFDYGRTDTQIRDRALTVKNIDDALYQLGFYADFDKRLRMQVKDLYPTNA